MRKIVRQLLCVKCSVLLLNTFLFYCSKFCSVSTAFITFPDSIPISPGNLLGRFHLLTSVQVILFCLTNTYNDIQVLYSIWLQLLSWFIHQVSFMRTHQVLWLKCRCNCIKWSITTMPNIWQLLSLLQYDFFFNLLNWKQMLSPL